MFTIAALSLLLAACGSSQGDEQASVSPLPAAIIGDLKNSNDIWNRRQPAVWSSSTSTTSTSGSAPSSRTTTGTVPADGTWLERVGMRPDWGPSTHVYSPGWDAEPAYYTYGSVMEDAYDPTIGYPYGGSSITVEVDDKGNGTAGTGNLSASRQQSNQKSSSSTTVLGRRSTSTQSSGGTSIQLPSGRTVDGQTNDSATSGSGRIVTLGTGGTYGTRGCPAPDPRDVTAGSGVVLPVLIKGSCPVTTTILRYPEQENSVFGSMDF